jgi:hypothetical protein
VQSVDVVCLKAVWKRYDDAQAEHPGMVLGADLIKKLCRDGEDVQAVALRCAMLRLLTKDVDLNSFPLAAQEVIFNIAATFPMTLG